MGTIVSRATSGLKGVTYKPGILSPGHTVQQNMKRGMCGRNVPVVTNSTLENRLNLNAG
jgi:hypothetical protein